MSRKNIDRVKLRRRMEGVSTFGLLLVAAAMIGPFATQFNMEVLTVFKWIYTAGALIYLMARLVGATDPEGSLRLRRLRRLEFWAGMCFAVAAFFWFYQENRLHNVVNVGPLAILQNVVLFTLAGAMIQVIASWMISYREKKEAKEGSSKGNKAGKTSDNKKETGK